MNIDTFLADRYISEEERNDYNYNQVLSETAPLYQDEWNPNYDPKNPDGIKIASTDIELARPEEWYPKKDASRYPTIQSNQIPSVVNPQQSNQIAPQFFQKESGKLLIPDGHSQQLAQTIYKELIGRAANKTDAVNACGILTTLLGRIQLSDEEVDSCAIQKRLPR